MNRPLLYLLLCMLLLPCSGSGQGVHIDEEADKWRKDLTEFNYDDKMLPSNHYRLKNPSLYLNKKVKKIELLRNGKKLVFMVCFDTIGRVVSQIRPMYRNNSCPIKTDSIFEGNKIIVVDSFFERNGSAQRIDTHIIQKIENQKWNNIIVSYDKVLYKSYKKGNYLEERNDYYQDVLKNTYTIRDPMIFYLYKYYEEEKKQIDGNFLKMQHLNERIHHKPKITSRKKYDHDKFYLCQKGVEYTNIVGADTTTKERLMQKSITNYYVVGEAPIEHGWLHMRSSDESYCGGSRNFWNKPPRFEELNRYNDKALIDTIFSYTYYEQTNEEPCFKPIDSNYRDYLDGYSGTPKSKEVKYTFRYEYFEE